MRAVLVEAPHSAWVEAGLWYGAETDLSAGHGTPSCPVEAGLVEAEGAFLTTAAPSTQYSPATQRLGYTLSLLA